MQWLSLAWMFANSAFFALSFLAYAYGRRQRGPRLLFWLTCASSLAWLVTMMVWMIGNA